ncbi:bifunctional tRNA (5-methylaminomethyl-2-thiouridine)(34)-methyltransferase MnmD/FAD-dependent 5-carboxymethylaminomethyl-2-thiouridine(34) oxidoreductase MnmC [Neptunicella marina]|uniref:tRNA 5-methylaminomethyl-2-thiouridine biosynthesis bifunctional protein MnmC n=1 Tax=Neptunicella marina TaxID=2125989 RepID=A0A8J6IRM1_9ALTE|nr:bifunctional tRNA (5-methylaminomethyl-2-thiouridine)(34)-methyltransferase MnmD/FAD-dependent 5-carboxymethylaminomethyl-2-thiouridine(34) oxidoreductase MnmC [Neptunicella marina]MBC3764520.1 bifunctional tRNA (5-methylaminomethyl-2-thiouridine)(34)-methyltransferase MnmD/FAD-dependent 5-carboxymethylaminomethyl-2-thiouridine(34) oxidoreductase MnmC [Neptunicella marina]
MSIKAADIQFNQYGTPFTDQFDDIYFSNQSGLQETEYVFFKNNQLPKRWLTFPSAHFTVAETGFGTGLNFLACWQLFQQTMLRQEDNVNGSCALKKLHFISVEKFPLNKDDLETALNAWPQLTAFSQQLIEQYPDLVEGCHRLVFDNVTLDLWFGDVADVFPAMNNQQSGIVDAWFLDGFAPSKNPQMWSQTLFDQMSRLAKADATFATFTAAGFVRRGLQQAGFDAVKVKGFGQKREMLAGKLNLKIKPDNNQTLTPWFTQSPATGNKVAIIGAGLAGANLAYSLSQRGYRVEMYSAGSEVAERASGNRQGGFYPQLHVQKNIASDIQALAFGFALRRYQTLLKQGVEFAHEFCGVLQIAFTNAIQTRYQQLADKSQWPGSLVELINATNATEIAGVTMPYPALHIKKGGWIHPAGLVEALIKQSGTKVHLNHALTDLVEQDNGWRMQFDNQAVQQADIVVLATGDCSHNIKQLNGVPYRLVRGQVEQVPAAGALAQLKTVLCHKGYLTPAMHGDCALGSTYIKNDTATEHRLEEQNTNLAVLNKALSECDWVKQVKAVQQGRASVRCSTPDHLPVAGHIANWQQQLEDYQALYKALPAAQYAKAANLPNLYSLSALGSRGLCTAPLLADYVASLIANEPLPLPQTLINALVPNRFLIRALTRRDTPYSG